jgi:hypothetical protein
MEVSGQHHSYSTLTSVQDLPILIFWQVVGLERGSLSLVSTVEELLGRKSSGSGLEDENTAVGIRHADHVAPSILKSWH